MTLSVVHKLLESHSITPQQIGRLEVYGKDSEKGVDALLEHIFDSNVEGVATTETSIGGVGALINSLQWLESSYSNGKYALMVASSDCTASKIDGRSGSASIAFLLGRDSSFSIDLNSRVVSYQNPVVDEASFLKCLEHSFTKAYDNLATSTTSSTTSSLVSPSMLWVLQACHVSWMSSGFTQLLFMGYNRNPSCFTPSNIKENESSKSNNPNSNPSDNACLSTSIANSLISKTDANSEELEKSSRSLFKSALEPSLGCHQPLGCLLGIASLYEHFLRPKNAQVGKPFSVFGFGPRASTIFQICYRGRSVFEAKPTLNSKLAARSKRSFMELKMAIQAKKQLDDEKSKVLTSSSSSTIVPLSLTWSESHVVGGAYYLKAFNQQTERYVYERRPQDADCIPETQLNIHHLSSNTNNTNTTSSMTSSSSSSSPSSSTSTTEPIVVTGVSAGLPCVKQGDGSFSREAFDPLNLDRLILGENMIDNLTDKQLATLVEKNVVMVGRNKDGTSFRKVQAAPEDCVKIASFLPKVDLTNYGVDPRLAATMDSAAMASVAAGLEALKNAGLVTGRDKSASEWVIPESLRDDTAVLYASSFPGLDAAVSELTRYGESLQPSGCSMGKLLREVRRRVENHQSAPHTPPQKPQTHSPLQSSSSSSGSAVIKNELSIDVAEALDVLEQNMSKASPNPPPFEFDRKFLFKVLCLGNAQLAQVCKARGPNSQTNAACAGTTQAVAMGLELLQSGKCQRVIVVAGDNATSHALLPWLGNGFRALGAASTCAAVCDAALPFDKRRSGMILGAGAVGIVFETASSLELRNKLALVSENMPPAVQPKCRLIGAQFSNSAYHGAALDRKHIGSELGRFLSEIETKHQITKEMIAKGGVFLSHETCTHASPSSSCAANEVGALRDIFGDELMTHLTLVNTKGFTGHAMGVSFEDVTAVELLFRQMIPPMPNNSVSDPYLGEIKLSRGGACEVKYALRFSAGFGSHVCFALYGSI
eukprot:CAMPEP_0114334912 /NCGR_PEP_ID=MMETSP0101-20121206/4700_1 /TAXON_ID=38822 ORGANISM="Pteridomonas danica, Strain PT" /NCGR_SAMPLE_ID=MMETSP0101 /ASSEMBLY_ACC=CAM_ASM_000211 /LENGTH=993 /DNA_ID=CAMNT_0001466347 /DNA_START=257 /DNA_END=3238 /DNA_ORIENTATION=-